jgi:hypothetical protein
MANTIGQELQLMFSLHFLTVGEVVDFSVVVHKLQ